MSISDGDLKYKKIVNARSKALPLAEIDIKRDDYCMSFGFDLEEYIRSIRSVGLLNSPTVIKDRRGKFVPVTGYRRLRAAEHLKWPTVPCRDLSGMGFSRADLLNIGLFENLVTRTFNEVEKGMVLKKLAPLMPQEKILNDYMPLLGLPSHKPTLHFYMLMTDKCDDETKERVAGGDISLPALRLLLSIDERSTSAVTRILANLKLSINKQIQFIEYLEDISCANRKEIADVLEEDWVREIIANDDLNRPQKAKLLLRHLRNVCFPIFSEAERSFRKKISHMELPEGVRIEHPPFFESPDYRLEVFFSDGRALMEKIERLKHIGLLHDFSDPWKEAE